MGKICSYSRKISSKRISDTYIATSKHFQLQQKQNNETSTNQSYRGQKRDVYNAFPNLLDFS